MAACLWAGDGLVAGAAAGAIYGLPDCKDAPVEIMTSSKHVTPHSGFIIHRTNWLPWEQVTKVNEIPVTSVERTLMSLCASRSRPKAAILVDQAITSGLTTLAAIDRHLWLTARQGRDGCRLLRELKNERWGLDRLPTTGLETLIFEMLLAHDLPRPQPQAEIRDAHGAFVARPDFLYEEQKVVIEGHSRQWHEGLEAVRRDEMRLRRLNALGYRVAFVTWADVVRNARATASFIRRMLRENDFAAPWRPAKWT